MNCTTAVFTLMSGAALLAFATLYTYNRNILGDVKQKMSSLNVALSTLQIERSDLINKSNDMYVETATKSVMADKYKEELDLLTEKISLLQYDNALLKSETHTEELDLLRQTVTHLRNDNTRLKSENNIEELESLKQNLVQLQNENMRLKSDSKIQEFDILKETVARLQSDNELLINAYQQLEKRV
jgi:hypothetical protein